MARRSGIGQDELRRVNLSALLSRVHLSGPTTRAALTSELGLNRSTIGDLTGQLEALGLVRDERPSHTDGTGRPSHVVVPQDEVSVLAVTLDVDRMGAAIVGLGGVIRGRRERQHARGGHEPSAVADALASMCDELLAACPSRCLGMGVSVPGVVRADDGLVRFAPNLGWVDAPFTAMLGERLSLSIVTANDADLGVLAEHLRGAAVGFDDVAFITGGVGIGGGFIVDGSPLRGSGGYAGEIGHLPVDRDRGIVCRCGARGCWETKVGENHLLEAVGRLPGGGPAAVAEVIRDAEAGDARAAEAVRECAHWAGVGLGAIINLFNPAKIVVGGLLAAVWDSFAPEVTAAMDAVSLEAPRAQAQIVTAGLGLDSSLIGAAELAFSALLADPMSYADVLTAAR
jgi:predicted NBD/HSP70 family sugar kinase